MITQRDINTALSGLKPDHPMADRVIRELWDRANLTNAHIDEHLARFVGGAIASQFKPGFFDERMVLNVGRVAVNAVLFGTMPTDKNLTMAEAIAGFEATYPDATKNGIWDTIKGKALEPKTSKPIRQYYYKNSSCKADSSKHSNCQCWHDIGSGPLTLSEQLSESLEWRDRPEDRA